MERQLWIEAGNNKSAAAQTALCEAYAPLIRMIADRRVKRIYPQLLNSLDDIVQDCFVALLYAWSRESYRFPLTQKDGTPWNGQPFWRHYLWRIVNVTVIQTATKEKRRRAKEMPFEEWREVVPVDQGRRWPGEDYNSG
jgi:DNA-directed RNA polymerase specialized sigma24 family protein